MRTLTGAATAAITLALTVNSVFAADLSNGAAADLEERVAELEAMTADKGTRKTTLVVYGEVSTAVLFQDNTGGPSGNSYKGMGDNPNDPTRFGFTGVGKLSPGWTAGYRVEIGVDGLGGVGSATVSGHPVTLGGLGSTDRLDGILNVRQANWWIESKSVGRVTMGRQDMADSGVAQVSLANTNVAALGVLGFGAVNRNDGVSYKTPEMGGFVVSASYANDTNRAVAIRYVGEGGGFRLASGVAYSMTASHAAIASLPFPLPPVYPHVDNYNPDNSISGSASIMHVKSGLFLNAAFGVNTQDVSGGVVSGAKSMSWEARGGLEKNLTGTGNTTFYAEYVKRNSSQALDVTSWGFNPNASTAYGAGVIQSFDSAALDLFAAFRHAEGSAITASNSFLAGAKIRF